MWEQVALLSLHQRKDTGRHFLFPPSPLVLVWRLSLKGHEEEKVPGFLRGTSWRVSSLCLLCCSSCRAPVPSMGHGLGLEITQMVMTLGECL